MHFTALCLLYFSFVIGILALPQDYLLRMNKTITLSLNAVILIHLK